MTTNDKTPASEEILNIQESPDGSAVVDLPDNIPSPQAEKMADGGTAHEDSDEADEAAKRAEIAAHGSVDPDAEAIREAKRAKRRSRKDYHKRVQEEKDMRLQILQRENSDMRERLSVVERKTQSYDAHQINRALEEQQTRINFANNKIREATQTNNGDLMISAQEMLAESSKNYDALVNYVERNRQAPVQQQQQQAPKIDPVTQRYASDWMKRNDWYDPQHRDEDSQIALSVDKSLMEEGYKPTSREYWAELDSRLQEILPNRYTESNSESSSQRQRPRSAVTGSGREASTNVGRNQFVLSPDQVRAMKDAGMWDDPTKKSRMIKRYAAEARNRQG